MRSLIELATHILLTLLKLCKPGGVKALMAENIALRQQLITLNRKRNRAPRLTTQDRWLFGLATGFITHVRLNKIAIILKPTTLLKFHKALVERKYKLLHSNKGNKKPGRKGPTPKMVQLIIDIKQRNPRYGYRRIAMQVYQSFGITISSFAVGRIIRKHHILFPSGNNNGPSWLTFIDNTADSLWSIDFFKCESITLKTHTVMAVIDQYSRRLIGISVHAGDPCGNDICRMFNSIISGQSPLPKHLSSDNDPLFKFHQWQANLRILEIDEIKSIPYTPVSHPFIERVFGSIRQEFLDHTLFWNERDLRKKLNKYKNYYNNTRGHSSLDQLTPNQRSEHPYTTRDVENLSAYRWQSHCSGIFHTPIAA